MKHGGIEEILRTKQCPGIVGTRDSFGIGRNFIHQGKEITTWKEWERAGYMDAEDSPKLSKEVKEQIRRKKNKIRREGKYGKETKRENAILNALSCEGLK